MVGSGAFDANFFDVCVSERIISNAMSVRIRLDSSPEDDRKGMRDKISFSTVFCNETSIY